MSYGFGESISLTATPSLLLGSRPNHCRVLPGMPFPSESNHFMPSTTIRTLIYSAFAAVICIAAVGTPALAKSDAAPKATASQAANTPGQLLAEARKITLQLNKIEKQALKNDKSLQAKSKHLAEHFKQVLNKNGYFPAADRMELISLKKEIEGGKLSKEKRKEKIADFRRVRARMMEGQKKAMQDKGLQKESKEFSKAAVQSMQKQDPRTEELMHRLATIRVQFRKLVMEKRQAMQKQAKH